MLRRSGRDARVALAELSRDGPVMMRNGMVYAPSSARRAWEELIDIASLETLDRTNHAGILRDEARSRSEAIAAQAEAELARALPECRDWAWAVLGFTIAPEAHRRGTGVPSLPYAPEPSPASPLHHLFLTGRPIIIWGNSMYAPRRSAPGQAPRVPTDEAGIRALPTLSIDIRNLLAQHRAWVMGGERGDCVEEGTAEAFESEAANAVERVKTALANPQSMAGRRVLYRCDETGVALLWSPGGVPHLTISSDAFAVEDGYGDVFRFDAFVLGVYPQPAREMFTVTSVPLVIYPANYRHWLPTRPLHMCTYIPETSVHNVLRIENSVSLLESGRHLLRAGLFGPPGGGGSLDESFRRHRIRPEQAQKEGIPIYPYVRTSGA